MKPTCNTCNDLMEIKICCKRYQCSCFKNPMIDNDCTIECYNNYIKQIKEP